MEIVVRALNDLIGTENFQKFLFESWPGKVAVFKVADQARQMFLSRLMLVASTMH